MFGSMAPLDVAALRRCSSLIAVPCGTGKSHLAQAIGPCDGKVML
jgi:hypothetical protein